MCVCALINDRFSIGFSALCLCGLAGCACVQSAPVVKNFCAAGYSSKWPPSRKKAMATISFHIGERVTKAQEAAPASSRGRQPERCAKALSCVRVCVFSARKVTKAAAFQQNPSDESQG